MAVKAAAAPIAIFGDLDGELWGVVIGGEQPRAAVARLTDADLELLPAALDLDDDDVWLVTSARCDLRVERADADSVTTGGEPTLQPCRVSGSVTIDTGEREFDIGGARSSALAVTDGQDSLRAFAAWFPGGHEVAVLAERPRGARGQDHDSIGAFARGEEHALVIDPRMSTTYEENGTPRRVGLELWLGDDEDGEQWPRRVAGAATGSRVASGGLSAYAFECVSRGEHGAGVYLLLSA